MSWDLNSTRFGGDAVRGIHLNYSSIFAVCIACMGLFGLSLISASSRIKEVGIRKVLGASTWKIVKLISKDLLLLVAAANILSWPIAYYVSRLWLQNFAYKTNLSLTLFCNFRILHSVRSRFYDQFSDHESSPFESGGCVEVRVEINTLWAQRNLFLFQILIEPF